jgi:phospholipase/lecithinase/hemolysin
MKNNNIYILAAALLGMTACKPNISSNEVTKGSADFSRYVAVGNSLCAGYTDGALSKEGQENSFPRMMAEQFKLAGGGEFTTPFVADNNGNDGSGLTKYALVINPSTGSLAPSRVTGTATPLTDGAAVSAVGPYNHVAVPGARAFDATWNLYGALNPFLARMIGASAGKTMISLAMEKNPTFFSYWLGANDVLGWATEGGSGSVQTNPAAPGFPGTLSHPDFIEKFVSDAIDSLTKNGAKGVVANIPDVASTPYFTTVPVACIPLTRQGQVDTLMGAYRAYDSVAALLGKPLITWKIGANAPVIADSSAFGFMRQATSNDLICLTASTVLPTGAGTATPLNDRYVLDASEIALAKSVTDMANAKIKAIADAKGLAFFDANIFLKTFQSGLIYNGVAIGPKFATGGGFGLDGVHPTPRGYALIANEFIKSINAKYGSTIPMVDVNKYRGVALP